MLMDSSVSEPTAKQLHAPAAASSPKDSSRLAIATVCVDEGGHRSPDGQINTAKHYMNLTMANHAAYAEAHGYAYMPLTHRLRSQKDVRYHKLMWVSELLHTYRWVFFTDCDALFVDCSIDAGRWPREAEAGDGPSAHLIFTGDKNWAMNSGQFFIRNTSWSRSLLLNASLEPHNTHGCEGNDNAAFNWLLWRDCEHARGNIFHDFTTRWGDMRSCETMIRTSPFADKLACAPINTYAHDIPPWWWPWSRPLFRVHVAGAQSTKLHLLQKVAAMVAAKGRCAPSKTLGPAGAPALPAPRQKKH